MVRFKACYWMFKFVTDTPNTLHNYNEDVSMELAKIVRETERLSHLVRTAEWLRDGDITEEQFLDLTQNLRAK